MSRRRRNLWQGLKRLESVSGEDCGAQPDVESPCTGVCRLDHTGLCADCHRTIDEITAWSGLSAADKHDVVAAAARRAAAG
jgi:predicted Fe-S protein YdhL (DUF1289 family)